MIIWGVIPARTGSQRISGKNMRCLGGRPLVAHTIGAAQQAETIDTVWVTTDDDDVYDLAIDMGARAHWRVEQSSDTTPASDEVIDCVSAYQTMDSATPDGVCMLLPTSPFRGPQQIDECLRYWQSGDVHKSVISVTATKHLMVETARGVLEDVRRIMYPDTRIWRSNGAIQVTSWDSLASYGSFHLPKATRWYELDALRGWDIDDMWELAVAHETIRELHAAQPC